MPDIQKFALLLALLYMAIATELTESVPEYHHYIAINSKDDLTIQCSVQVGWTAIWEVNRTQIYGTQQFITANIQGYSIQPMNTESESSNMTISMEARVSNTDSNIVVKCLTSRRNELRSCEWEIHHIILIYPPEVVHNFDIVPSLMLVWDRPTNVPSEVSITYTVEINSTDGSMSFQNITSETTFSVHFLEEMLPVAGSQCVEFEFFVSATNDAGTGPTVRILDTVPISPDVTNISTELRVERVDIQSSTVNISFPAVIPCSRNFTLTNYTVNINNTILRTLRTTDPEVAHDKPSIGIILPHDNVFYLTVTTCNNVTCRTSANPRKINTTDVQSVEAVFFENRLFLRCSFADNSQARGCIVNLILSSTKQTERFEVARQGSSGSLHTTSLNQREVYSSVVAMDWEANENSGNVTLNVTNSVQSLSSLEEFSEQTGYKEVTDIRPVTIGVPVVLVVLAVVIIMIVVFTVVCLKQRHTIKNSPKMDTKFEQCTESDEDDAVVCDITFKGDKVNELTKLLQSEGKRRNSASVSCTRSTSLNCETTKHGTSSKTISNGNDSTDQSSLSLKPPPFYQRSISYTNPQFNCGNVNQPDLPKAKTLPTSTRSQNVTCELELSSNSLRIKLKSLPRKKEDSEIHQRSMSLGAAVSFGEEDDMCANSLQPFNLKFKMCLPEPTLTAVDESCTNSSEIQCPALKATSLSQESGD